MGAGDSMNPSGAISRHDVARMNKHANQYYEQIRKRKSDVSAIAKHTGFPVQDIQAVKNHIFVNYHDLGRNKSVRFAPDYDMAVSWQRLIDGRRIQKMDIILLKHELHELKLMSNGMSYDDAHIQADRLFSFTAFVRALDEREGIR